MAALAVFTPLAAVTRLVEHSVADADRARYQSDLAPVARARVWAVLQERDLVLEGTAWDPATRSVLVGSLHKDKIVAISEEGRASDRVASGSGGLASVVGIHVDTLRGVLWAASNARYDSPADTRPSTLFAFRANDGQFIARYALQGPPRAHFLNDVTTTSDGTVFVTDSRADAIWRLRPGDTALSRFEAGGTLPSPNGITVCDRGHLFVAVRSGLRVIPLDGGDAWQLTVHDSIDLPGVDGLAFADNALIAHHPLSAARVARYELDEDHRAIIGRTMFEAGTADARTSTTGEVVNDEYVFIGNGQLDRMNDGTIDAATMQPIRMYRIALRPPSDGHVVVALSGRDSVAVLDAQSLERVATLAVGRNPHEITASPDGRSAYVANAREASISAIEVMPTARETRWPLPDSVQVHDLTTSDDGRAIWAASGAQQVVLEIDAATGSTRTVHRLARAGPWMLESTPDRRVIIAHLEGAAITLLDPASGAARVFPAREGEIDAMLTPDGREIWSVNFADGSMTAFDAVSGAVLDRRHIGPRASRLLFTPDRVSALVVSTGDSTFAAYNLHTRERVSSVQLVGGPKVLALSRDGRRAYVTHPERGALSMIDVASMTILRVVPLPGTPDGVAVLEPAH